MLELITSRVCDIHHLARTYSRSFMFQYIYLQTIKNGELSSDVSRYQPVHLFTTFSLKLRIFEHSFTACQRCRATSKSYKLQIKLLDPCATYTLTLHIRVQLLQPTKDTEVPPSNRVELNEQNVYKRQASQRQKISHFLSVFVSFYLSPYFFFRLPS